MPEEVDKSLLDRLAALRGSSPASQRQAPVQVQVDVIERRKTPSREDALASRLKSLRSRNETPSSPPPSSHSPSPQVTRGDRPSQPTAATATTEKPEKISSTLADEDVDAAFLTDDRTLEELLGDVGPESEFNTPTEPDDDKVKALLEELSQSIPQDDATTTNKSQETKEDDSDDDSDGEKMNNEVDDVIARFRDEIELEAADEPPSPKQEEQEEGEGEGEEEEDITPSQPPPNLDLPSVPQDPAAAETTTSPPPSTSLDDITARLSALRASSASPSPLADLPSVPTSRPAKEPKRLTSRTNYTDDDVDSWCTVCLEDATLKCLGCDGDPYCVRCWREMHVGPAASFDDRDHKAVHFTKDRTKKEKRVALGA